MSKLVFYFLNIYQIQTRGINDSFFGTNQRINRYKEVIKYLCLNN